MSIPSYDNLYPLGIEYSKWDYDLGVTEQSWIIDIVSSAIE